MAYNTRRRTLARSALDSDFDRSTRRVFGAAVFIWVVGALLSLTLTAVFIWAIIALVTHFTG